MLRALTGIKPTNLLHLGNYFGALVPACALQETYRLSMMVADLHAITVAQDPKELERNSAFIVATYLAAGIDPQKTLLFQQSAVPAHAELAWLLQCVARMGEVERMTQYKDKALAKGEMVSVGLFTYPILMAADILLYDAEVVPVGADQLQHLELTRDLAERFNKTYGETFVLPKAVLQKEGAKILGLDDPQKKMSKSAPTPKNYISILDDADTIAKKIKSAVTDSEPTITNNPERLGVHNLLTLFSCCTGTSLDDLAKTYETSGTKIFKEDLTGVLIDFLSPLQKNILGLMEQKTELARILTEGNQQARERTSQKITIVKEAMGLKEHLF